MTTLTIPLPLDLTALQQSLTVAFQTTGFDPKSLVGLSGVAAVESAVKYLNEQWNLSKKLSPYVAIIVGVLLNILLALALKNDVLSAVYIGFFTGLLSSVWHEKTKPTP